MMQRLQSAFSQHRILGGAAVLAFTQFLASAAGFFRERVLVQTFPQLGVTDVYYAAFRPSDLLFQVTIMAAYSVALVPLLSQYRARNDDREMGRLLSSTMLIAGISFGMTALLLAIFFPLLAPLFSSFEGQQLQLYVRFGQLALISNFLFVFGNACGQYLITMQRYWVYGLTPVIYTAGTILGTLYLTPLAGSYGPMLGTLCGAVLYVLWRLMAICRLGYRYSFVWWHGDIAELGILMLPRTLALGALQFQLLLFDKLATGLDTGAVTVHALARNVQSMGVGIVGIALAQSVFSLLSQAAARCDVQRYHLYLRKGAMWILCLTLPGAVLTVVLSGFIGRFLFSLSVGQTAVFASCLIVYSLSLPIESLNHLLLRAYYARKSSLIPALLSVVNGGVAVGVAWYFIYPHGILALAAGFTAGQTLQLIFLSGLIVYRRHAPFHSGGIWRDAESSTVL